MSSSLKILGRDLDSPAAFRMVKRGELRKLFSKVYTTDLESDPEALVMTFRYELLSFFCKGCVFSHRTAFKMHSGERTIFLSGPKARTFTWPGLTVKVLAGPGNHDNDMSFKGLYISSPARALLENLQVSKTINGINKCISREEIETELDGDLDAKGEDYLKKIKGEAGQIAKTFGWESEYSRLSNLIGALLQTRDAVFLKSKKAKARAMGLPYDESRVRLFQSLFDYLRSNRLPYIRSQADPENVFSFMEAYFSNYIEGTTFNIDEAESIVFDKLVIPNREDDSHDIIGTFNIVSNADEMSIIPESFDQLINILQRRHKVLMSSRPTKLPGEFKVKPNQAGNTKFVAPGLVDGTLRQGFEFYEGLPYGFARAAYMMFLISEVHPFADGNGRIARIMMNAELEREGEQKIIIWNSYRGDYLRNLKGLTRNGQCEGYVKMLGFAQEFSGKIPLSSTSDAEVHLVSNKAFDEDEDYAL
ncbi:MAG: Fic family protein [Planctomycetes bacterium]|nr:Fic family protein [Planctomycetota bacterium]